MFLPSCKSLSPPYLPPLPFLLNYSSPILPHLFPLSSLLPLLSFLLPPSSLSPPSLSPPLSPSSLLPSPLSFAPLPSSQVESVSMNFAGFSIGSTVVFGYSFLIATFVLFLVTEKETKVRGVQGARFMGSSRTWFFLYLYIYISQGGGGLVLYPDSRMLTPARRDSLITFATISVWVPTNQCLEFQFQ